MPVITRRDSSESGVMAEGSWWLPMHVIRAPTCTVLVYVAANVVHEK